MEERVSDLNEKFEKGMTLVVSDPEQSFKLGKQICKISDELQIEHSMVHVLLEVILLWSDRVLKLSHSLSR